MKCGFLWGPVKWLQSDKVGIVGISRDKVGIVGLLFIILALICFRYMNMVYTGTVQVHSCKLDGNTHVLVQRSLLCLLTNSCPNNKLAVVFNVPL